MYKRKHMDLRKAEKSLTRYVLDHAEILNKIDTKNDLIEFIENSKNLGYSVSDKKLMEVVKRITKAYTFNMAHASVYNLMLAGANLGINKL